MKNENTPHYKLEEKIDSLVNSLNAFKQFSSSNDTTITENFRILEDRIVHIEQELGIADQMNDMEVLVDETWLEEKIESLSNKVNYLDNKMNELDSKVSSLQYEIPKGFIEILQELKKIQVDTAYEQETSNGTTQSMIRDLETPVVEF